MEKEMRKLLRRGKREEFEAVVRYFTPYLMTVVQNQLGPVFTRADAEEVCLDVFLALWDGREGIRTDNLRGWLVRVARNKAYDRMRKRGIETVPLEDWLVLPDESILDRMERRERDRLVRDALDSLGETGKEIFLRYYYYDQTVGEIASEMGMNPETVKSRLKRGREALKKKLEEEGFSYVD